MREDGSIAMTKLNMSVVDRKRLISPEALLVESFTQQILDRVKGNQNFFPYEELEFLDESHDEEGKSESVREVNLSYDLTFEMVEAHLHALEKEADKLSHEAQEILSKADIVIRETEKDGKNHKDSSAGKEYIERLNEVSKERLRLIHDRQRVIESEKRILERSRTNLENNSRYSVSPSVKKILEYRNINNSYGDSRNVRHRASASDDLSKKESRTSSPEILRERKNDIISSKVSHEMKMVTEPSEISREMQEACTPEELINLEMTDLSRNADGLKVQNRSDRKSGNEPVSKQDTERSTRNLSSDHAQKNAESDAGSRGFRDARNNFSNENELTETDKRNTKESGTSSVENFREMKNRNSSSENYRGKDNRTPSSERFHENKNEKIPSGQFGSRENGTVSSGPSGIKENVTVSSGPSGIKENETITPEHSHEKKNRTALSDLSHEMLTAVNPLEISHEITTAANPLELSNEIQTAASPLEISHEMKLVTEPAELSREMQEAYSPEELINLEMPDLSQNSDGLSVKNRSDRKGENTFASKREAERSVRNLSSDHAQKNAGSRRAGDVSSSFSNDNKFTSTDKSTTKTDRASDDSRSMKHGISESGHFHEKESRASESGHFHEKESRASESGYLHGKESRTSGSENFREKQNGASLSENFREKKNGTSSVENFREKESGTSSSETFHGKDNRTPSSERFHENKNEKIPSGQFGARENVTVLSGTSGEKENGTTTPEPEHSHEKKNRTALSDLSHEMLTAGNPLEISHEIKTAINLDDPLEISHEMRLVTEPSEISREMQEAYTPEELINLEMLDLSQNSDGLSVKNRSDRKSENSPVSKRDTGRNDCNLSSDQVQKNAELNAVSRRSGDVRNNFSNDNKLTSTDKSTTKTNRASDDSRSMKHGASELGHFREKENRTSESGQFHGKENRASESGQFHGKRDGTSSSEHLGSKENGAISPEYFSEITNRNSLSDLSHEITTAAKLLELSHEMKASANTLTDMSDLPREMQDAYSPEELINLEMQDASQDTDGSGARRFTDGKGYDNSSRTSTGERSIRNTPGTTTDGNRYENTSRNFSDGKSNENASKISTNGKASDRPGITNGANVANGTTGAANITGKTSSADRKSIIDRSNFSNITELLNGLEKQIGEVKAKKAADNDKRTERIESSVRDITILEAQKQYELLKDKLPGKFAAEFGDYGPTELSNLVLEQDEKDTRVSAGDHKEKNNQVSAGDHKEKNIQVSAGDHKEKNTYAFADDHNEKRFDTSWNTDNGKRNRKSGNIGSNVQINVGRIGTSGSMTIRLLRPMEAQVIQEKINGDTKVQYVPISMDYGTSYPDLLKNMIDKEIETGALRPMKDIVQNRNSSTSADKFLRGEVEEVTVDDTPAMTTWNNPMVKSVGGSMRTLPNHGMNTIHADEAVRQAMENQVNWVNPAFAGYGTPENLTFKNNGNIGDDQTAPQKRKEARISEAEIRRTADRVFKMVEERIRKERRRIGRI